MKINMPATQLEYILKDNTQIVSRTDLKGIITYINDDFTEVSGFTEDELIGQSHNIARHPDMPPETFANLWATVKQEKPWFGIVKNRCKNGDYYWVETVVSPITKGGVSVGFIFVCKKATRQQVEDALNIHRFIHGEQSFAEVSLAKINNLLPHYSFHFSGPSYPSAWCISAAGEEPYYIIGYHEFYEALGNEPRAMLNEKQFGEFVRMGNEMDGVANQDVCLQSNLLKYLNQHSLKFIEKYGAEYISRAGSCKSHKVNERATCINCHMCPRPKFH